MKKIVCLLIAAGVLAYPIYILKNYVRPPMPEEWIGIDFLDERIEIEARIKKNDTIKMVEDHIHDPEDLIVTWIQDHPGGRWKMVSWYSRDGKIISIGVGFTSSVHNFFNRMRSNFPMNDDFLLF